MGAKTKKAAKPKTKKTNTRDAPTPRKIRVWRTDVLEAARNALGYSIKDIVEKSRVNRKVVERVMQGDHKTRYESLESVVSSLFLKMEEVYNPKAPIAELTKEVNKRAKVNRRVRELEGVVIALKPDGAVIQIWRTDALEAARNALEYTAKDVIEKSRVNQRVVERVMRGDYKVNYESLESVVSSLFLKMEEVYNPKTTIAELTKEIYQRAKLNRRIREVEGAVIALKPDGTVVPVW